MPISSPRSSIRAAAWLVATPAPRSTSARASSSGTLGLLPWSTASIRTTPTIRTLCAMAYSPPSASPMVISAVPARMVTCIASSTATEISSAQAKARVSWMVRGASIRASAAPWPSGTATKARNAMLPSVRHCAVRAAPESRTLAKPKISSSRSIATAASVSDDEGDVAPRDVPVDRQHLPAQHVGAGREVSGGASENVGIARLVDRHVGLCTRGRHHLETGAHLVDAGVELDAHGELACGNMLVRRRASRDDHSVGHGRQRAARAESGCDGDRGQISYIFPHLGLPPRTTARVLSRAYADCHCGDAPASPLKTAVGSPPCAATRLVIQPRRNCRRLRPRAEMSVTR